VITFFGHHSVLSPTCDIIRELMSYGVLPFISSIIYCGLFYFRTLKCIYVFIYDIHKTLFLLHLGSIFLMWYQSGLYHIKFWILIYLFTHVTMENIKQLTHELFKSTFKMKKSQMYMTYYMCLI
jgi:hypothetical protein